MKNGMMSSLLIAAAVLFSCEKEEVKTNVESSNDVTEHSGVAKAEGNMREWHDNGDPDGIDGVDYGCWNPGVRCFPDVDVTYSTSEDLGDITDVINTENEEDIISSFEDHETLLTDVLGSYVVKQVIDGNYTVATRGELNEDENIYFLFSSADDLEEVKPVGIE